MAAFAFMIASPLTRNASAEPTFDGSAPASMEFSAGPSFSAPEAPVVQAEAPPVKVVAKSLHRARTPYESFVSRWYRVRLRVYSAVHMYPRPYFDPMWVLELSLVLGTYFTARQLGLLDEVEDEEQTA